MHAASCLSNYYFILCNLQIWKSLFFNFLFILFPLSCGVDVRWHTSPCGMVIVFISRQSLLFDIILYFVQPSSLRSSSLPSPLYFNFHRPPSNAVFLHSHHMPIPLQPPFLDFLAMFPFSLSPLFLLLLSCPKICFLSCS